MDLTSYAAWSAATGSAGLDRSVGGGRAV